MNLKALREQVWAANMRLAASGLVKLTWGNVSGISRADGVFLIKPSGVPYDDLQPEHLVAVDLEGRVVAGTLNPSSDTPTHLVLYRAFAGIGGIAHTHSVSATAFAQAGREIDCLGTTHADHFHGAVPVARALTPEEVESGYETHTGTVIVERFKTLDPVAMPAVLAEHHAPFTWGRDAQDAVNNSIALETVAEMASRTLALAPDRAPIPDHIRHKHYSRKHGPDATYGQR